MGEGDRCTICLVEMVTADHEPAVIGLVCGHSFHTVCLVPWLEAGGPCPNCRFVVFEPAGFEGVEGLLSLRTDRRRSDPGSSWSSDLSWSSDSSWSSSDEDDESDSGDDESDDGGYRWSWSD